MPHLIATSHGPEAVAPGPRVALVADSHLADLSTARRRRADPAFEQRASAWNASVLASRDTLFELHAGIAVIRIEGMLVNNLGCLDPWWGMTGYDGIRAKLNAAVADPDIAKIALLINSGGGEVAGCADTAEAIFQARQHKIVAAILNEEAYSAAYWLGSAAHSMAVPRTGGAGSLGAVGFHLDVSEALRKDGLTATVLRAGARKAETNPYEPLSEAASAAWLEELASYRRLFIESVARYRSMDPQVLEDTEARTVPAITGEALRLGLVDAIASPAEAWQALAA